MNPMRQPRIEKVTVNIGIAEGGEKLAKAAGVIETITGKKSVNTMTFKRIPDFGIRPKMTIGAKVTLRGQAAEAFLKRALEAIDKRITERNFDKGGNFSFGIKEHIDIPGVKYDPTTGIIGMDVCATLERPGYRVKRRRLGKTAVGRHHKLTKEDGIKFITEKFGINFAEEGERE